MTEVLHELVVETFHVHAKLFRKMVWTFLRELLEQRLQLRVGRLMRNSRPQPDRRNISVVRAPRQLQGKVDIGIVPCEPRGHHAHDRVALVNQLNLPAQHSSIAVEMALPKRITQNRYGFRVLPFSRIRRKKRAAQQRRDAKMNESVCGHVDRGDRKSTRLNS